MTRLPDPADHPDAESYMSALDAYLDYTDSRCDDLRDEALELASTCSDPERDAETPNHLQEETLG